MLAIGFGCWTWIKTFDYITHIKTFFLTFLSLIFANTYPIYYDFFFAIYFCEQWKEQSVHERNKYWLTFWRYMFIHIQNAQIQLHKRAPILHEQRNCSTKWHIEETSKKLSNSNFLLLWHGTLSVANGCQLPLCRDVCGIS